MTDTGEWTTRRYLALLGNILIWVIVAIDAWYLWPTQLHGSTSMVIVSGRSMEPTYFGGDLVIARKVEPSVGDVIVYAPEGFGGSQIVHRIIGGNAEDGWQMRGDNNDFIDPFTPRASEVKGVVLVHYANFGRVTVLLLNPIVWALVLLAAIVLLVWWTGDTCEDDDEDKDKGKDEGNPKSDPEPEEEPDLIDRMVEGTEAAVAQMVGAGADAGAAVLAALTRPSRAPRHAAAAPRHAAPALLGGSAIVAVLGLVSVFGLSPASASQLNVNVAGQASVTTLTKCMTGPLTATATGSHNGNQYTHVTISGIGAGCAGLPIVVNVRANSGDASGSAPLAQTGSQEITTGGFNVNQVSAVVVRINGWLFTTTWMPAAVPPTACTSVNATNQPTGQSCSVTLGNANWWWGQWLVPGTRQGNATYHVSTAAANAIVTLDLSQTPYTGWATVAVRTNNDWIAAPGYSCSEWPIVRLYANPYAGGVNQGLYIEFAENASQINSQNRICP